MKKLCLLIVAVLTVTAALFVSCAKKEPYVVKESDKYIVITVSAKETEITENTTLVDYMNALNKDGELNFEMNNGMVTSVNGIENKADYSSCWMLYTSDTDNANDAWGTVEYKGKVYGSSTLGAESLKVKENCVYIWVYTDFNG